MMTKLKYKQIGFICTVVLFLFTALNAWGYNYSMAEGEGTGAKMALNPPSNIACLPFAQPTISEYNGDKVSGPYIGDADRTFITWKDESVGETEYRLYRQEVGQNEWVKIADLPANTSNYLDTGLSTNDDFLYRPVAVENGTESTSNPTCRRPKFVEQPLEGETAKFRVFYRPYSGNKSSQCPDIIDDGGKVQEMCSSQATAERIAQTLETARASLIALSFNDAVPNAPMPVDLSICDGAGCALSNNGTSYVSLRPASMSTPFNPVTFDGHNSIKVPLHETFHKVQKGLDDPNDRWVIEGQARSSEDKVCMDPWPQDPQADCTIMTDLQPGSVYVNEVNKYLGNPNRPLPDVSYQAVLFWTYITEKYGTTTKEPQRGIDWLAAFWVIVGSQDSSDTMDTIDDTLFTLGYESVTFTDVYKNFMVANYAKDIANAPDKYTYIDETQPMGNPIKYNAVPFSVNQALTAGQQYLLPSDQGLEFISRWGARYYRFVPDASVQTVHIEAQTLTQNDVYYTLLAVKGGDIVAEINRTDYDFYATVDNDNLDEVVLVVAGLYQDTNIALAVNGTEPTLEIVDPLTNRKVPAGDPTQPEKILVQVEVLSPQGGGTPMKGLDLDAFTVTVGSNVVSPDQMISTAYIQGEYWMVLRAPTQTMQGTYDLHVDYGLTLSDTEASAVTYDTAIEADNMLIIDRSGSMADFNKLDAAQDAGRLYVDSWEEGDQVGLVSYADTASLNFQLQDWTETSRTEIHTEIDNLTANGATAIGAAMIAGLDEFEVRGRADANIPWAMILLSDGEETVAGPPLIEDFVAQYDQMKADGDKLPQLHIVALGADADQATLQKLASDTGGTYHFAAEPTGTLKGGMANDDAHNDLAELYRVIGETIVREQQIYSARDTLQAASLEHTIQVDGSASEAVFVVNWFYTDQYFPLDIKLKRPDGTFVTPVTLGDLQHVVWRVPTPAEGEWQILLAPINPGRAANNAALLQEAKLLIEASLKSDLTLEAFLGLAVEDRLVDNPMPIYVSLSDNIPLTGSSVVAEITSPGGTLYNRTLHDDGLHGDGAADDGFYSNTFYQTQQEGVYQVTINASGTSPLNGDFNRRAKTAFYMAATEDTDGDGVPDRWENEHGTDPTRNDLAEDPDGDGLTNREEHLYNTHPLDPDTDDGGEHDGSEVGRESNPNDPTDDFIRPPRWKAWPGAQHVVVRFTRKLNYHQIRIMRATQPEGPYTETTTLDLLDMAENYWVDTKVENDNLYCYNLIGIDRNGFESGSTNSSCTTPKADPSAPFIRVEIEGDAPSTTLLIPQAVVLTLDASDSPSDAESTFEEDLSIILGSALLGSTNSGVTEMMISNRADFMGATWEPFQEEKDWVLEPVNSVATVYVQVRDAAGNISEIGADAILIQTETPTTGYQLYLPLIVR